MHHSSKKHFRNETDGNLEFSTNKVVFINYTAATSNFICNGLISDAMLYSGVAAPLFLIHSNLSFIYYWRGQEKRQGSWRKDRGVI